MDGSGNIDSGYLRHSTVQPLSVSCERNTTSQYDDITMTGNNTKNNTTHQLLTKTMGERIAGGHNYLTNRTIFPSQFARLAGALSPLRNNGNDGRDMANHSQTDGQILSAVSADLVASTVSAITLAAL